MARALKGIAKRIQIINDLPTTKEVIKAINFVMKCCLTTEEMIENFCKNVNRREK